MPGPKTQNNELAASWTQPVTQPRSGWTVRANHAKAAPQSGWRRLRWK